MQLMKIGNRTGRSSFPEYTPARMAFRRQSQWFQLNKLPGTTHFPMLEQPANVAAAIREFTA